MYTENPAGSESDNGSAVFLPHGSSAIIISALVCAALSIAMMRAGFLSLFFLAPLGFCAVAFGSGAAWLCFCIAAAGNAILAAGISLFTNAGPAGLSILFFTVLALGFTWIMADNPPFLPPVRIRTVFRFIAASFAGALTLFAMLFTMSRDEDFISFARSTVESISSAYIKSAGIDAAQQTLLERILTPDKIIGTLTTTALNGGALVSVFFMFFFNRQLVFILARLFRRLRYNTAGDLIGFYAPKNTIWFLILCLPVILLCRLVSLGALEVAAWNLLVVCAVIFLAQGGGIALFTLVRRPIPGIMRLLTIILFVFLVFSPGINALVLGLLILLGIAENWLPMRKIVSIEKSDEL